jgi:uncharacterized protein with von Willebrand factor type A (vWA) domain
MDEETVSRLGMRNAEEQRSLYERVAQREAEAAIAARAAAPPDIARVIIGFARALRAAGIAADPIRTQTAMAVLDRIGVRNRAAAQAALRASLCGEHADLATFDAVFTLYFSTAIPELAEPQRAEVEVRPVLLAVPDGLAGDTEETSTADAVGSSSQTEVLRVKDFAQLETDERAQVRRMIAALRPGGPMRPARRTRPASHGDLDPAGTARATLRHAGELDLRHSRPVQRPRRIAMLLDVSGSMASYADAYLRFAHVLARRRRGTEVFTMGTRLTRVTRQLGEPDVDLALQEAAAAVPDWSGGTRLGDQLQAFLDRWGQRGSARGALVIVASDGWERGDTELLEQQMARLARLAFRVIWVNPHSGKDGFAPSTAGMRAALPSIDVLHEGHSVESFDRLCSLLSDSRLRVSRPARRGAGASGGPESVHGGFARGAASA